MENIELYKKEINSILNIIEVNDGKVVLKFANGDIILEDEHEQSCCESVYADFEVVKYYIDKIKDKNISSLIIKGVKEMGFLICLYVEYDRAEKIFIPCYNIQNGYYSDELKLKIINGEITTEIDITQFKEDSGQ